MWFNRDCSTNEQAVGTDEVDAAPAPTRWGGIARAGLGVALTATIAAGAVLAMPGTASAACSTAELLHDRSGVDAIEASAQQDFHQRLNSLRRSKGLRTLVFNETVTSPAISWSETMSAQVPPGGSAANPGWLHHAVDKGTPGDGVDPSQDYVKVTSRLVGNWRRLAENVGVGGMYQSCSMDDLEANTDKVVVALHDAFVASHGHYVNMVGEFNQVGIGVHIDADSLWVTVRFADGDLPRSSSKAVAATPATRRYIDAAHRLFLGRTATSADVTRWAAPVQSGDRNSLTSALAVSDAWSGTRINDLYGTVLGRSADASGRSYWVSQIARGLTLESAAASFYGSAEYFTRNGGTNQRYVMALYRDLLDRASDRPGLDYWTTELAKGRLDLGGVAENFYASIESRRDRATRLHRDVFAAEATNRDLDYWAGRLAQLGDVRTAAEMAATSTFWNNAVS